MFAKLLVDGKGGGLQLRIPLVFGLSLIALRCVLCAESMAVADGGLLPSSE